MWKDKFYSSSAVKNKVAANLEHSYSYFSKLFFLLFLAKMLHITRTSDSVIYSILCYFLHFRPEHSTQHLFAIPYFPLGEKQICPHAEIKLEFCELPSLDF